MLISKKLCECCGSELHLSSDRFTHRHPFAGDISLDGPLYFVCEGCRRRILPYDTAKEIERIAADHISEFLLRQPIGDFIQASDLSVRFGISKPALLKKDGPHLRKIFHLLRGKAYEFFLPSVNRYEKLGDGRYLIAAISGTSGNSTSTVDKKRLHPYFADNRKAELIKRTAAVS